MLALTMNAWAAAAGLLLAMPVSGHATSRSTDTLCFNPPYETRVVANERLGECFPAGTDAAAFVKEMDKIADRGAQKQRVFDAIENREFDGYGYELAIQRPDGHTDTWRMWALADIDTGEILVTETAVIYEPEGFAERGLPFEIQNFYVRDLSTALMSYLDIGASQQQVRDLMASLGTEFYRELRDRGFYPELRDPGELVLQYTFKDPTATMAARVLGASNSWLISFTFDPDNYLKDIYVSF